MRRSARLDVRKPASCSARASRPKAPREGAQRAQQIVDAQDARVAVAQRQHAEPGTLAQRLELLAVERQGRDQVRAQREHLLQVRQTPRTPRPDRGQRGQSRRQGIAIAARRERFPLQILQTHQSVGRAQIGQQPQGAGADRQHALGRGGESSAPDRRGQAGYEQADELPSGQLSQISIPTVSMAVKGAPA